MKLGISIFFTFVAILYNSGPEALAEIAEEAPDVRVWAESLPELTSLGLKAPTSVALLTGFQGDDRANGIPVYRDFDPSSCRKSSYLNCRSSADATYSHLLNTSPASLGLDGAFHVTGADAIVYPERGKVYLKAVEQKEPFEMSLAVDDLKALAPAALCEKIIGSLGYDGVVLDVRGGYVLVGSSDSRLKKPNIQGLSLSGSAAHWDLLKQEKEGAGLLALVNRWNGFGVFRVVISGAGQQKIQPGSKIILESK